MAADVNKFIELQAEALIIETLVAVGRRDRSVFPFFLEQAERALDEKFAADLAVNPERRYEVCREEAIARHTLERLYLAAKAAL